ncbi:MAG TPA: type II secretion system protein [Tepidisphaeraceae bacterium]
MIKKRRGFTVLELTVTISVIVILMALLVVGVGHVVGGSKEKQSRVTLENLRNLVAELEMTGGLRQAPRMWVKGQQLIYSAQAQNYDIWHYYDYSTRTQPPFFGALYGDQTTMTGPLNQGSKERFLSDAVANTQLVMGVIQQIPSAKTILANLPADSFMETIPAGNPKLTPPGAKPNPPLIMDGWRNPIILAPAAGIWVSVGDPTTPGKVVNKLIKAPDNRPFWVSAGPDGFITDNQGTVTKAYGEDNLYSFER